MITLPGTGHVMNIRGFNTPATRRLSLCFLVLIGAAHSPAFAAGASANDESKPSPSLRVVSRFVDYRTTDGVLQGYDREAAQWVDVPRRRRGEDLAWSEQRRALAIADSLSFPEAGKSEVLFSEGFETGVTCPYCPSAPEYYGSGTWNSWDFSYEPDFGDGETIWGRTCAKKYSGNSSVWSSKWHRDCVSSSVCTGYTWQCTDAGGANPVARNDIDSCLRLMQPIAWPGNRATTLKFRTWQGLQPENSGELAYDWISVWVYDATTQWEYLLWSDYHRRTVWSLCEVPLPSTILVGHSFKIHFYYWIDLNYASAEGVFLDDLTISATDVDLEIVSISQALPTPTNADLPARMVARVRNIGSDASVPTVLAYTQNRPLPTGTSSLADYTGYVSIPSLASWQTYDVDVLIDYANGIGKAAATEAGSPDKRLIQHELKFRLDPENRVFETDEGDNDYAQSVWVAWNLEKPIIILVHGILGGGLAKDNESVWNDDAARMAQSLMVARGKIARDSTTVNEADGDP